MITSTKIKMLALAFCIASISIFSQTPSSICRLGDIKKDSLLPFVDSLQINCASNDPLLFKKHSGELRSLKFLILQGNTNETIWGDLFKEIKEKVPSVKTIIFDKNTFSYLPNGSEKLFNIENLTISNNEQLDYLVITQQLTALPNLKELTLDIYSIYDIPDSLTQLKNISKIYLVNKEELLSESDPDFLLSPKETVTYDFTINNGNKNPAILKYTTIVGAQANNEYQELSRRFNTSLQNTITATTKSNLNTYIPKYNFIKPPIKGLDVERNFYTINPDIPNVLVYPSGTKILIPANAFTDSKGNPVKESVTISYREFRDPVDILVSGIPMKYDSAGASNNFESAGMFEINASINKQPLQLATGKKIRMNFASTSIDSTYNFYSFNDSTGNWTYKTKPNTVTTESIINLPPLTPAYNVYSKFLKSPRVIDKTLLNKRFESLDYIYTYKIDTSRSKNKSFRYRSKGRDRYKAAAALVKINRIRKNKEGDVFFRIRFLNDAHPELNEFNSYYFALDDNLSANEFKQKFAYKKSFNDIRIISKGSNFELKFKDPKGFKNVNAHLVIISDQQKIKEIKNIKSIVKKYSRRLNMREKAFNKKIKNGKNYYDDLIELTNQDDINLYAYEKTKAFMTKDEKKMSPQEFRNYFNLIQENLNLIVNNSNATANNLMQSLTLDGMGVYNCDQIMRIKDPVEIFASYQNNSFKKLSPSATYIIDKKINAVLKYDGYGGFDSEKIAFSKSENAENVLITINSDGSMGIYKSEDFKKNIFKNKSKFDFEITEINSKDYSVGDLKKIIGL